MTTVFTIAGYDLHGTSSTKLSLLNEGLRSKGYNVVPVDIDWKHKTHTQYIKEFVKIYDRYKTEENIVLGNSFGAAVAFISAPIVKPDKIYLCSLSPFFKEDRGKYSDEYTIDKFGVRRAEDFWSYSAGEIADEINSQKISTMVVYGGKERQMYPILVERCRQTAKKIVRAELIEMPDCPHNLSDETYSKAMIGLL